MSNGQMVEDVRLAVEGRRPVSFYSRVGGVIPTVNELIDQIVRYGRYEEPIGERNGRKGISEAEKFLWAV